jgi:hypothetical protein
MHHFSVFLGHELRGRLLDELGSANLARRITQATVSVSPRERGAARRCGSVLAFFSTIVGTSWRVITGTFT